MSLTSAPVFPCSCAEGWKPEGWAYCAGCYEGQIERLRAALQFIADGYDNQDVNHVDFRVKAYQVATETLAALAPAERGGDR